jgi:hypothetical protein
MVRPRLLPVPFRVPEDQHDVILIKWLLYLLDLNLLDYGIWGIMQAEVNDAAHLNVGPTK